jgi:hypothetical protein
MDGLIARDLLGVVPLALIAGGVLLAARAIGGMGLPSSGGPSLLRWIRRFRKAAIGLAFAGVGAGWLWQQPWLIAISLGIGLEETLESSFYIAVLERSP